VSLTADVAEEVKAGYEILKALDLRHRGVRIISCPTCARRGYDVEKTIKALEERLAHISRPLSLAVMGCVVNGPGEAGHTDFGVCGGKGDENMIYVGGRPDHKVKNENIVDELVRLVEEKVKIG
ncbi:MAG: flavodoxin-dependent (E)-4-hydroxy-3-methylbut-2-enyl-diphosphate synthase, partial [Pseudomonadota bacterium]|nr:flavodoxin-dependent (E)-4-hydroxy-3-methylbut-2-enyl-diphosphate synthase [Pseudomonadota bacterium]